MQGRCKPRSTFGRFACKECDQVRLRSTSSRYQRDARIAEAPPVLARFKVQSYEIISIFVNLAFTPPIFNTV